MPPIRFPGLGSSIDFGSIVQQLVALESRNIQRQRDRQSTLKTRSDAWKDLTSRLDNLKAKAGQLRLAATLGARKVDTTDDKVVTATASSEAVAATYRIQVETLASQHKVQTGSLSSASLDLASQGVTTFGDITVGKKADGTDATITVNSTDTLTSLAAKINQNSATVRATVIKYADNDFRLQLTTAESGVANNFTTTAGSAQQLLDGASSVLKDLGILDAGGALNAANASGGTDAVFYIDGSPTAIRRSTNVINDVITGVTFTLKRTSTSDGTPAPGGLDVTSLTVSSNREEGLKAIKEFVEAYNSAYTFIESKVSKDSLTGLIGPLSGESSVNRILTQLRQIVSAPVTGLTGSITSLTNIGISTGKWDSATKNQLEIDETKLTKALDENIDKVMELFGAVRVNVATGASVVASGTAAGQYDPAWVVNGNKSQGDFGQVGGGWKSAQGGFPHSLQLNLANASTIDRIVLHTLPGNGAVRSFKVYAGTDNTGTLLAEVTGNTADKITVDFTAVTTGQIFIEFTESNDGQYTNVVEIEVEQQNYGVSSRLFDFINGIVKSDGTAQAARDRIAKDIEAINNRVKRMEEKLALQEDKLYTQFARLDRMLASINRQGSALSQMIGNL